MKDETEPLVNDVKILSEGLIVAIEKGNVQEALDYVKKMNEHLTNVKEYLEMKKSIPE